MKPEETPADGDALENPAPVAGDVIGDTAYSQRFVLKILLKFANLDTLREEIKEKAFEEDLCTLWDMTAQRDVVLFMQKHDVLNLFSFALPIIDSPRMVEIVIGIIANMCCCPEAANALLKMEDFSKDLLENIKTDDSMTLVQVLRLVSSSLYLAGEDDVVLWMDLFESVDYSAALYFIMKNSTHKLLLITSVENLNTITSYCNVERARSKYFTLFVSHDAIDSLFAAFTEILGLNEQCERDELERFLLVSLQIVLNLIGFENSPDIFSDYKESIVKIISSTICYYEDKLVNQKELDTDFFDVLDSATTIVNVMQLNDITEPDKYFSPTFNIWKSLKQAAKSDRNGSDFDDDDLDKLHEFASNITPSLATFIGGYVEKCSEKNLKEVLDTIDSHYEDIVSSITDESVKANVSERTSNHRSRLKDNIQSQ